MDQQTRLVCKAFFNTSIADVYRSMQGASLVGAYTLLFCSINAIAYIGLEGEDAPEEQNTCAKCNQRVGQTKDSKVFQNWVERWIKKREGGNRNCNPHFLYCVRNCLVHVHGSTESLSASYAGFRLTHDEPKRHWERFESDAKKGYYLNLESLLAEYVAGASDFFQSVKDNPSIETRLKSQLRTDVSKPLDAPHTYRQMHYALDVLDKRHPPDVEQIRRRIHDLLISSGHCTCKYHEIRQIVRLLVRPAYLALSYGRKDVS